VTNKKKRLRRNGHQLEKGGMTHGGDTVFKRLRRNKATHANVLQLQLGLHNGHLGFNKMQAAS
jgi:hypothetical protein